MGTHVSFIFRGYNPYIGINVGNIYQSHGCVMGFHQKSNRTLPKNGPLRCNQRGKKDTQVQV